MIPLREVRRWARHRGVVLPSLLFCLSGLCLFWVLGASSSLSLCRVQLVMELGELGKHGFCLEQTSGISPGVWIRTEKEYLVIGKGSGGTGKRIWNTGNATPSPVWHTCNRSDRMQSWWHLTFMIGYRVSFCLSGSISLSSLFTAPPNRSNYDFPAVDEKLRQAQRAEDFAQGGHTACRWQKHLTACRPVLGSSG